MIFIEQIAKYAVKYMKQEGILASLTIAQATLESDFGKSELAVKANNLFGMKANSNWNGAKYKKITKEFINNEWVEVTASFCKFDNIEECIKHRSAVFLKKARYKPLWGLKDYKKACFTIYECGYATDPAYPQKIIQLIEKYELYKYDKEVINVFKISWDAGHGGNGVTPGKRTPDGAMCEWDYNNAVVKYAMSELANYEGVAQLRVDDVSGKRDVPLKERTNQVNAWDSKLHISVHANAYGNGWNDANGIETYVYKTTLTEAMKIAKAVQVEMVKATGLKDRGVKAGNLHMVRETKMTAILVEGPFMTNKAEAELLKSDDFRRKVATAIVKAIVETYGLKKKAIQVEQKQTVDGICKIDYKGKQIEGIIINGVSYAPVRQMAEFQGLEVGWDQQASTVTLK